MMLQIGVIKVIILLTTCKGVFLMRVISRDILILSITSFILQYVWEYWQCSIFYIMPSSSFSSLMIKATVGDVILSILLFIIIALADEDFNWFVRKWKFKEVIIIILFSLSTSFYFESNALFTKRWSYSDSMPLFLNTNIGLIPVIQLLILFPFSFLISRAIKNLLLKKSKGEKR